MNVCAVPQVVATIKPLHSLVAFVMKDVGTPDLLMEGYESPHTYQLRPSKAQCIAKANIIFWVGPSLEAMLEKPIKSIGQKAQLVTLEENPTLNLLSIRHDHDAHHDHDHHGSIDGHLWLSLENASKIADLIATTLSHHDPDHLRDYQRNAAELKLRLQTLQTKISTELKPLNNMRFLVFHDAYQYFEKSFGLTMSGSITLHPDYPLTPLRMKQIHETMTSQNIQCIFTEPQFQHPLPAFLKQNVKMIELDPIGVDIEPGPEAYFLLMEKMTKAFLKCQASDKT